MTAPSSTARSAVAAFMVSTLTGDALGDELFDDGEHPLLLDLDRHTLGPGPGGLTADVDQVRSPGDEVSRMRHRGVVRRRAARRPRTSPA